MRNSKGQFVKGHKTWNKGLPMWWDSGKKFKKGHIINIGRKCSEATKKKLSEAQKGKKHSKETKRKISRNRKGEKFSEEHKRKISEALKGKGLGKDNSNWQGGTSFEPYPNDWTETLKRSIRERDNYTCQLCGQYGNNVHHIDYNKKNCNPNNLITLCRGCNSKVNFNRKYWIKCFGILCKTLCETMG